MLLVFENTDKYNFQLFQIEQIERIEEESIDKMRERILFDDITSGNYCSVSSQAHLNFGAHTRQAGYIESQELDFQNQYYEKDISRNLYPMNPDEQISLISSQEYISE